MKLTIAEDTPFIMEMKLLVVVDTLLEEMIVEVATLLLMVEDNILLEEVALLFTCISFREEVAITPLILVVNIPVEVEKEVVALDMAAVDILVVATLPLTLEVNIFPEVDRSLLLTVVVVAITPLILEVSTLAKVDTLLEEMIVEVAVTPLIMEVKVLPLTD